MLEGLTPERLESWANTFDGFASQLREAKRLVEDHDLKVAKCNYLTMGRYLSSFVSGIPEILDRVKGQVTSKQLGIPSPEDVQIEQSIRDKRTKRTAPISPAVWEKTVESTGKIISGQQQKPIKKKRRRK